MNASDHVFKATLRTTNSSHAVMQTTWPHPSLHDLEATTFSQDDLRPRNSDIVEENFAVTLRCVVVAEHGQRSLDSDPWGICWNEDDAVPFALVGVLWI
jgi:hypothetical protein